MVIVDDSSLQAVSAQVRWLGLRVGGRLALFYIHHMNRVNFRNDIGHDDSTIMKKSVQRRRKHAGCSKAADPFPGARNGQNLISWRW